MLVIFMLGKLVGVNDTCVELEDGGIVYETGDFAASEWADFQRIGKSVFVQIAFIESFTDG